MRSPDEADVAGISIKFYAISTTRGKGRGRVKLSKQ